VRDAILAFLLADSTLMDLLSGGLYDKPISKEQTPNAFDANSELLPCGYVGGGTETPIGPTALQASLQIVPIYLYQRVGHTTVDAAVARLRTLLHKQRVAPASGGVWTIHWVFATRDVADPTLSDARLTVVRFSAAYSF